ncbi:MAG: hypothetical protein Q9219_005609 [cf. Caloplaca sp. 3 TL-2023]
MSRTNFWFGPDEQFRAAREDCAIVNGSGSWLWHRHYTQELWFDDDDDQGTLKYLFVNDALYGDSLRYSIDTRLLYADVDSHDPSHADISHRVAEAGFLEEESSKSKEAKGKLIDYLAIPAGKWDDVLETAYDAVDRGEEDIKKQKIENRFCGWGYGALEQNEVDYILGLEDEEDRREILNACSGQHMRKLQRPVVLLIGMIEDPWVVDELQSKKGWAIVYNFYDNRITVKPFLADLADEAHHPLAQKWNTDIPDDGISLIGHPAAVVEKILQLEAIQSLEDEKDLSTLKTHILVYYLVSKWLIDHGIALTHIKQADGDATLTDDHLGKLSEAKDKMLAAAAKIPIPHKKRQRHVEKKMESFQYMQRNLEDGEMSFRNEAVEAKAAGNEAAAEKAAKLYDQLWKLLQEFNMDPENEA